MASVINDVERVERINARLVPDAQEVLTPGEAITGLIRKGWGLAKRPLSLTPQFCAHTPRGLLCREGVHAEMFNRVTLGRTREEVYTEGGALLLSAMALAGWAHEGIAVRCKHLDTTRLSLTGAYVPDPDEHALVITHGDSTDPRPDLQQAVLAWMVSQAGGVPLVSPRGEGPTSDTTIFQARAQGLMATLKTTPRPRYLVADAKRSHEDNAANLHARGCITRMPNPLTLASQVITDGLRGDTWPRVHDTTRSQRVA
jgi:transposase